MCEIKLYRELEESSYQETIDSLDTGLMIYLHGFKIESANSNKKYTLRYTTENGVEKPLTTGQFKVYFKDGTSKILSEITTIKSDSSVKSELTFESSDSNAYRIEYGIDLKESGSLPSFGSLLWVVSSSEFDDEDLEDDEEYEDEDVNDVEDYKWKED